MAAASSSMPRPDMPVPTANGHGAPTAAPPGADERMYFSREAGTWRFEDDDGNEMEYDASKAAWVPVLDDDVVKMQQAAYSVSGVDEEAPAAPVLARLNKKRKEPEDYTSATSVEQPVNIKRKKEKPGKEASTSTGTSTNNGKMEAPAPRKAKNTSVYVKGLPADTTHDELVDRFRKFGVLEEDDEGEPKIKLYAREDGVFSGDALVVYFKEESVTLACTMLDDAELRIGQSSTRMSVAQADFSHKNDGAIKAEGSDGPKPRKTIDKKKATRRITNMKKKLEEWDDEDNFGPAKTAEDDVPVINKNGRVVVLKYMFTAKEIEEDASLLLDLKDEVREECETLGEVTNVVLYDQEPDGIMTVKFREPLSAQACVIKMNGRFFAGRKVEASLYAGKQRFKRGGTGGEDLDEGATDEAEKKRLDNFAQWLMTEGD